MTEEWSSGEGRLRGGVKSRRTLKICPVRQSTPVAREYRNTWRKHQQQKGVKGGSEKKKRLLSEVHESSFTQLFPVLWCIMLSRRTDLKSSASAALHEGTASRLVIPVRFLRICLIYYVSRKNKMDTELKSNELFDSCSYNRFYKSVYTLFIFQIGNCQISFLDSFN